MAGSVMWVQSIEHTGNARWIGLHGIGLQLARHLPIATSCRIHERTHYLDSGKREAYIGYLDFN
jgi:hypothetical protein